MKTLDELVADKILDLLHYVLSKIIKPDMTLNKVNELDIQAIEKLKQQYGIEAIILDVDDTLRKEMKDIPKCNKEWIEGLKGKIKIMIVSNGVDRDIEKYFKKGELIPAIVQEEGTNEVLMLAYMNRESMKKTLETGYTWFWSRSRQELWNKGATSGHLQKVVSIYGDCDDDTLLVKVIQTGAACHTGNHSCFFNEIKLENNGE